MHIRILGSAAGGGYPQWNCNCRNCLGLRKRRIRSVARTQSSIAVSANAGQWVLFNCSPDVRAQFEAFPPMQPARSVRDTGMSAIVLIDSQIDHTTGLLTLREGEALEIYCTGRVHHDLVTRFPVLQVLEHYCGVHWHEIPIDGNGGFVVPGQESLRFTAVALSSKAPPYSEDRNNPQPGDTIGVQVRDFATGSNLFYAPGLGVIEPQVRRRLEEADCLLVDGTFWQEDELQRAGISARTAAQMGHLPQSGPGGMMEVLSGLGASRKILIHINNTNPILDEDSAERAELDRHGIEVAYDGMEIVL